MSSVSNPSQVSQSSDNSIEKTPLHPTTKKYHSRLKHEDLKIINRINNRLQSMEDQGNKLTQAHIAQQLFGGKGNQPYVSSLLKGKRKPTRTVVREFAKLFGCKPEELDPSYHEPRRIVVPPHLKNPHAPIEDTCCTELVADISNTLDDWEKDNESNIDKELRSQIIVHIHNELFNKNYSQPEIKKAFQRFLLNRK